MRHLRMSPQRRITPAYVPHCRQPGGAPRPSRRFSYPQESQIGGASPASRPPTRRQFRQRRQL
ncbi:MAG: hypothetical protein ABI690_14130 [Chloroflexota bacterium]